jgi:hypothetical protein
MSKPLAKAAGTRIERLGMSQGRFLTKAERDLAESVFGGAVDYDSVRIANRKWAFFQPKRVVMAPRGTIHFHPHGDLYCEDFCGADLNDQGLFIHEMTHVWQHQSGVNLILRRHPFCRYDYELKPGKRFTDYGIEQQAEIVRHAFLLREGAVIEGDASARDYERLLPFGSC